LYVDAEGGSDANDGLSLTGAFATLQKASDAATSYTTIYVCNGTYRNADFRSGSTANGAVVAFRNLREIVLSNLPGHVPRIEFDGLAGVSGYNVRGFEVRGFEVEGPARQITYEEAMADRSLHSRKLSGRGIFVDGGDHIHIHDNVIHHAPGAGIRVDGSDYCTVAGNVVYNSTWWSTNAESGIVIAQSNSIDTDDGVKMTIRGNTVFGHLNYLPSLNTTTDGAIVDGSGILVSQNSKSYLHGWFEISENVCHGNGIDGILVQATNRIAVSDNVLFSNGLVTREPSVSRQSYTGLTLLSVTDVFVQNNSVSAALTDDYAYKMDADSSLHHTASSAELNYVCVGQVSAGLVQLVEVIAACIS